MGQMRFAERIEQRLVLAPLDENLADGSAGQRRAPGAGDRDYGGCRERQSAPVSAPVLERAVTGCRTSCRRAPARGD